MTGRQLGSQYALGSLLGRGSTGRVYEARRSGDGERLAVKLLREDWSDDDQMLRRLLAEKRVLAALDHPNIVRVFDLVIDDGQAGIVMELVSGGTLRPLIKAGPMPAARVASLGRQLALALDAAHTAAVVHGDVKPENVLVAAADPLTVKLSDFGIARLVDATASKTTSRGGTPSYMAPELITGEPVGAASDVYSLGVLLYEALAGRPPFTADSPIALWKAHVDQPPPRPAGVSDAWWALLSRMLAKTVADRPTAAGVAAGLAAGAEPDLGRIGSFERTGEPTLLPTGEGTLLKHRPVPSPPPPAPAKRSRRPLAVGGAVTAVLLVVTGALAWMNGWLPANAAAKDKTLAAPTATTGTPVVPVKVPSTTPSASISPSPSPSLVRTTAAASAAVATKAADPTATRAATTKAAATKAATKAPDTTAQCQAASNAGGLDIGPELNNSGGPNRVPDPCTAIWMTLTEVHYITHAKACLEDSDGTDTRCGGWIYLEDGGAWNKLLDGVSPGARWQLYLKAEGEGHVAFDFSG